MDFQEFTRRNKMLYNLSWLQPGKPFPPTAEKARIQRYKENAQLFDNEHFESSVLRHRDGFCSENTGIAVYDECARRISRVIGNFENIISFPVLLNYQRLLTIKLADLVCGEFPSITGADEEDNKKLKEACDRSDLQSKMYSAVIDISRYGDAVQRVYLDNDKKFNVVYWDPKEWFPIVSQDGTRRITAHCLCWLENIEPDERKTPKYQLHAQIHETAPNKVGTYTHKVFDMNSQTFMIGKEISSETVKTGLKTCAVRHLKSFATTSGIYGYDDYMPIDSILSEIMARIGQISVILDKHADPNITGPVSMLSRNEQTGELYLKTGKFFAVSPGEEQPKYMTWEGQLDAAFKQLELLINQLYILSEMGAALLGDAFGSSQAISGTAMRFKMTSPLAKARRVSNSLVLPIRELMSQLTNDEVPFDNISVIWRDGLPDDPREQIEVAKLATGVTKMMPLSTAIMEYFGKTQEEANRWIALIGEETKAQMELQQSRELEDPNKPGPQDGTGVNPQKKGSQTGINNPSGQQNRNQDTNQSRQQSGSGEE